MSSEISDTRMQKARHSRSPTAPSAIGPTSHGVQKHRRLSSTGGGRAWTEEEEAYLIRTRMHKMPYKHIAAHLRKTELACRLHYHQMSFGSNRRRRSESLCSTSSSYTSSEFSREHLVPIAPASPETQSCSPSSSISNSPNQSRAHVPILPKQVPSLLPPIRSVSPEWNDAKRLRLDTSFTKANPNEMEVDMLRLQGIYNSHRDSFWSVIASEFSNNPAFTGPRLEEAFFNATTGSRKAGAPPTPSPSPRSSAKSLPVGPSFSAGASYSGFRAVNGPTLPSIAEPPTNEEQNFRSTAQKCTVSSLLNSEREVWAPKEISSA